MPRSQADTTAAALLGTWTDSDTAMQIVGTSLGLFGPGSLKPERALSHETPLRNALFDVNGLVVTSRTDLAEFQKPFAQDRAPVSTFVEAIEALRPTGIIGVSTAWHLLERGH